MDFDDGTREIINVFYEVYNKLGFGFLEAVYEEAMALEFKRRGVDFGRQVGIDVCIRVRSVRIMWLILLLEMLLLKLRRRVVCLGLMMRN